MTPDHKLPAGTLQNPNDMKDNIENFIKGFE